MLPFSSLHLAPVQEGATVRQSLANTLYLARQVLLARRASQLEGIASAATAVVIGAATRTIRVRAGGVISSNHVPLTVAEAFGTLAELHPGRIDHGRGGASVGRRHGDGAGAHTNPH